MDECLLNLSASSEGIAECGIWAELVSFNISLEMCFILSTQKKHDFLYE